MPEYQKTCTECNKAYIAGNRSSLYCPECRVERNRKRNKEYYQANFAVERKVVIEEKPKHFPSIEEIRAASKPINMSYGKYVAMTEMGARYE